VLKNKPTSIAMVSYLNSKPFEFGINSTEYDHFFELFLDHPAACAALFASGQVDVALIPVGALQGLEGYRIVTDYCISCDGEVRTVCLFSDTPIENCSKIWLDDHSRTSFLLTQVIIEQYFGKSVEYQPGHVQEIVPGVGEATLMIGDKVFSAEQSYRYKYDLGEIWKKWTGLPFVFAVWVASDKVDDESLKRLNNALEYGVSHLKQVIDRVNSESLDLLSYFSKNIFYELDDRKMEALSLFQSKCKMLKSAKETI
jgi:chorismate dehydratase